MHSAKTGTPRQASGGTEETLISRANSDRLIGLVIAMFGAAYSLHTLDAFDLGTFRRIGPGMFPLGLGIAMTLLGVAIAIVRPDADRDNPDFALRPMILVLLSVGAFAGGIATVGLFPAVVACVVLSSMAERPFRILESLIVAGVLCVGAWLIFKVGLGLSLPLLKWPF